MAVTKIRRDYLTRRIFRWARGVLPSMSQTEREALEAGDVWWDAELFGGNPDWRKLRDTPEARLTKEERDFIAGPVAKLCGMLDDWQINWHDGELPEEVWAFMKKHRFFGMIIPKDYGGLAFSAYAHSEVVRRVASRSVVAAVTVMVPNSLGPGELLMQFGTKNQRDHWLPRLADGREIPCFGLTSPEAGSDAAAMQDTGVVCEGTFKGRKTLGIRLNWHKRYITLGPVATVLGLAFKLKDPDGHLGGEEDVGITVALVPTDLPGVETGRRHLPSFQMFQNGPTTGKDVFIPLDHVIGGKAKAGHGWAMLMSALAAGRGISLPSLSAAGAAFCARSTGAYARIREQFGIPIGKFEGVEERLGRLAATAYLLDAARRLTCAGLDEGRKLAVISAIMKAHATYRMRTAVNDALDVHAGKGVIDGPSNYLGNLYRAVPVGITVEGANILTRSMIIFGQGSVRCHPYLLDEMLALEHDDPDKGLADFDKAFWGHVGHAFKTLGRAWVRNWTGGRLGPAPADAGPLRVHYKQLARYAASLALAADMALLTLGGQLKRKEMISARLGDVLSELYLLSAVLKRWEDEGCQAADLPLVDYCMAAGCQRIERALSGVYHNLPARWAAWLQRFVAMPLGARRRGPSDRLIQKCAEFLLSPSATRDRLTDGLYRGDPTREGVDQVEYAFELACEVAPMRRKLREAGIEDPDEALAQGIIVEAERDHLEKALAEIDRAIQVDSFAPEELTGRRSGVAAEKKASPGKTATNSSAAATTTKKKTAAKSSAKTAKTAKSGKTASKTRRKEPADAG